MQSNAMIIILSAPSGCGKSSIARKLLETDTNLALSISSTTRTPRPGELEGKDYFFKTKENFYNVDYLEASEIYGNFYGTPREFVEKKLLEGKDVLFDIDFQGAYHIIKAVKTKVISIFILPPDIETLRKRMIDRGQDDLNVIEMRLQKAQSEIEHAKNYNYIVVNDNFDKTVQEIRTIISAERNKKTYDTK